MTPEPSDPAGAHERGAPDVPLQDRVDRDLIADALDDTLIVEAAAGTGKTTELVRRVLRVLAAGRARVGDLVAVTFTEKAAGELKLRLRQELEAAQTHEGTSQEGRTRLHEALRNLEEAHISTIHGFCADLLRERPVEAGLDPLFSVFTEAQARRCYDEAFDAWFQASLEAVPEGVRRSLRRSSRLPGRGPSDEDGPVERLRAAGWALSEWRDFPAEWTRPDFDRPAAIEALAAEVHAFAALTSAGSGRDALFLDTAAVRRASDELRLTMPAGDGDGAEAVLVDLARDREFGRARKGSGARFGHGVARADVHAAHQGLVQRLEAFRADADADLAALLRNELRGSIARYERLKTQHGAVDFLDLLLRTRNLVRDRDDVRHQFQERFTCLFVDEFQDTDPLQAEILILLAADDPRERDWTRVRPRPGKLFLVGDPKQSIYRFRRADVGIYGRVCDQLARHGARRVRLTTSFRSVPNLQHAINAAFEPRMTGDVETLQAAYVPLAHFRSARTEQPSVVALPVPAPYGKRNVSAAAIERSLPDAAGAFIEWLLHRSGWTVTERRGEPVPVQPGHVCILFRRFVNFGTDVTRAYVDALEARGIKHLLVGGRAFHGRAEIDSIRAALAAVEWPDDELSVFATLRGAFFAIGDEELLEYRHGHATAFHPFRIPASLPEHLAPIGEALRLLADLHARRNRRTIAETLARLFAATRAHVGFALRRAGEQVLANALHVAELARQYERSDGISFRGFVDELRRAAEDGQAAEAPIVEEGSDGVRLMTVHKAKGLEFPVVLLADITAKLAPMEAPRHLDASRGLCALRIGGWSPRELLLQQPREQAREREEGVRIAYVAATRARDLLVLPAVGDQPYAGGWTGPLDDVLYPPVDRRRAALPAPRCPPFRKDSVLVRPGEGPALPQTVQPGAHAFEPASGGARFDVVWWDPAALQLGAEPPFGLRRQELISRHVEAGVVAEGQRRYIDWRNARERAVTDGRTPSLHVLTATEWAARRVPVDPGGHPPEEARPEAEVVSLDPHRDRPGGARYGTLVHAVLASAPLDADAAALAACVSTQGRIVAASDLEMTSAAEVVAAVLRHPLLERARQAARLGRCFRETPVTLTRAGVLIEGVVDLAFDEEAGWVVLDFKTGAAEGDVLAQYRRQVGLYAAAIAAATARPARAVVLEV